MIPFDSWGVFGKKYIENVPMLGTSQLENLEASLSKLLPAIVNNSYQGSFEIVLETLGCSQSLIPVILPITARPCVFAAVLRSGGLPFLMDIHPETFQLDPNVLEDALTDFENGAIVILTRPCGKKVHTELLDLCKNIPTIIDNGVLPCRSMKVDVDFIGDFNIYSLEPSVGCGGVIYHKYLEQVQEMKNLRRSLLHQDSILPEILSNLAERRLWHVEERNKAVSMVVDQYTKQLPSTPDLEPVVSPGQAFPFMTVRVQDCEKVIHKLRDQGISVRAPFVGLHHFSEVSSRFQNGEVPEYINTKLIESQLVALPCHPDLLEDDQVSIIVEKLMECVK